VLPDASGPISDNKLIARKSQHRDMFGGAPLKANARAHATPSRPGVANVSVRPSRTVLMAEFQRRCWPRRPAMEVA
jgi:hypothetical protein